MSGRLLCCKVTCGSRQSHAGGGEEPSGDVCTISQQVVDGKGGAALSLSNLLRNFRCRRKEEELFHRRLGLD